MKRDVVQHMLPQSLLLVCPIARALGRWQWRDAMTQELLHLKGGCICGLHWLLEQALQSSLGRLAIHGRRRRQQKHGCKGNCTIHSSSCFH